LDPESPDIGTQKQQLSFSLFYSVNRDRRFGALNASGIARCCLILIRQAIHRISVARKTKEFLQVCGMK